jgi:hypothetical protein
MRLQASLGRSDAVRRTDRLLARRLAELDDALEGTAGATSAAPGGCN